MVILNKVETHQDSTTLIYHSKKEAGLCVTVSHQSQRTIFLSKAQITEPTQFGINNNNNGINHVDEVLAVKLLQSLLSQAW